MEKIGMTEKARITAQILFVALCLGLAWSPVGADDRDSPQQPIVSADSHTAETPIPAPAATPADVQRLTDQIQQRQPEWVRNPQGSSDGIQYLIVESKLRVDPGEAARSLREEMERSVQQEIDKWIKPGAGRMLGFDWRYIEDNLRNHEKTAMVSVENPHNAGLHNEYEKIYVNYTQLALDKEFQNEVFERWEDRETASRIMQIALIGGGVMFGLFAVFGFFRVDDATRGFYTRRLQLLALFVIVAAVGLGLYLGGQFPWL